jgi:hypothetical protein
MTKISKEVSLYYALLCVENSKQCLILGIKDNNYSLKNIISVRIFSKNGRLKEKITGQLIDLNYSGLLEFKFVLSKPRDGICFSIECTQCPEDKKDSENGWILLYKDKYHYNIDIGNDCYLDSKIQCMIINPLQYAKYALILSNGDNINKCLKSFKGIKKVKHCKSHSYSHQLQHPHSHSHPHQHSHHHSHSHSHQSHSYQHQSQPRYPYPHNNDQNKNVKKHVVLFKDEMKIFPHVFKNYDHCNDSDCDNDCDNDPPCPDPCPGPGPDPVPDNKFIPCDTTFSINVTNDKCNVYEISIMGRYSDGSENNSGDLKKIVYCTINNIVKEISKIEYFCPPDQHNQDSHIIEDVKFNLDSMTNMIIVELILNESLDRTKITLSYLNNLISG